MPANTFISMYQLLVKLLQVWLALLLIALINIAQALPAEEISRSINQVSTPNLGEEKEILVVGSEEDYPPFSTGMTDATAGGFTIDLWKAVAAEAKVKYTLRVRPFHVLLEEFKAGKIDVLTNLAISKERHKFADFTIPHAVIHGGIFVREIDASKINSESDLNEKSIIVVNADMANEYVISKGLGKQLIKVNNATEGMQLLSSGKYDAMLINKVTGLQALQTLGIRNIKLIKTNAGFEQKFSFAVLEGHSELLSKINEALVITKSKGTYDKLYEKWFGIYDEKEVTLIDVLNWLLPVLVAFLAIALYAIHKRRVEIKISQAQLKASETHLRLSQKVGGIGTWEADLINNTQYWSENCIELLGLHAIKRPTWEDFLNLIHEDDRQYVIDSTKSHIEHGTKYAPEYRMVDSSGSIRWLRSAGQVECDIDGTPIKMRGIAQDITEHKLAEANLIKAEKFSSAVIESSPIPLAVNDDHGNITYLNPAFLHLVGYSHNEISTIEAWWLLACPDEKYRHWIANQWQKNIEVSTQHNKPFTSLEVNVRCKDESIKTFICSAASLVGDFDNSHLVSMYDITDRKHAEEELKKTRNALLESRDRYEDLYEFAPIGYLSLNNHGLIDEVNWKVTALFGLSRKELNQHRFAEFVEEEDKAYWQRTYSDLKTLVGGEELSVDIKLKHSNGNMFYASLNCLRMDDSEEQPILRITLVDITNLKKAEDQLIQSEAYLSTIIENEPECIKVVDAKGYLKQMNPAGLAMLEADSLAQVTGVPLLDFIAPEYQKAFKELHKRVIAGESMQLEFEVIGLKGGRKWLETHAVPILDNNKKLLLGVTRDITERKQTELRIEKLVAQQATILDNKMVGIVIARDRKIVWANLAYEIMFGYSKKELIGMPTKQLYLNEEDYGAIGEAYQNIENEGIVRKQFSFVRKDGEEIWLNLSGSMLDKETGESLWIFVDMTALKQAEDVASTVNSLLKTVIDTAPMRIFWKDTQSRYLGCNPAFAKDADEIIPESIIGKDDSQMPWTDHLLDRVQPDLSKASESHLYQ